MDAVIGTNNIVGTLFNQIAQLKYAVEEFFTFDPSLNPLVPYGEMLARDAENGSPKGYLFDEARQCGQIVNADLAALKGAIAQHLAGGHSNTINLAADTFASPKLVLKLDDIEEKNPTLVPARVGLEITEQGGVPKNLDIAALKALTRKGYNLFIDDFDINNYEERPRLQVFGPHARGLKLDHNYAEIFRSGSESQKHALGQEIHAVKDAFPNLIIVLEGIRGSDAHLFPTLYKAGIRVVQQSGYNNDGPVKLIDRHDIELALHL